MLILHGKRGDEFTIRGVVLRVVEIRRGVAVLAVEDAASPVASSTGVDKPTPGGVEFPRERHAEH